MSNIPQHLMSPEEARALLPLRPPDAHKGAFGHLLVLAGSRGFTGAARLACDAACRAGVGLVTAGVPASLADIVAVGLLESMTAPLPATHAESLAYEGLARILDLAADKQAIALGPGLSRHPDTARLVRRLALHRSLPMVVDADALNALAEKPGRLTPRSDAPALPDAVFTPHPGEMARLTGLSAAQVQEDRSGWAARQATLWRVTVLLKGHHTVIAAPEGRLRICPTGNSGMATGGAGDVLTGIIGALLAQGMAGFEAACLGAYAHGLAGDLAAGQYTERGMTARDILEMLPTAWRILESRPS